MIDLNSRSQAGDRVNWHIDQAMAEEHRREGARDYLGCSYLGETCERAVQYTFTGAPREEPNAQLLRRFQRGHIMEDQAAAWLRSAGFDLRTESPQGGQYAVVIGEGLAHGHADGILSGFWSAHGPCPIELPALWECKWLSHKFFMQIKRDGLKKAAPKYEGQVQLYMGGLGLTRCLFTTGDADDMTLRHMLVAFDQDRFGALVERARRVHTKCRLGETLPRCANKPTYYVCKMCSFSNHCWRDEG